MLCAAHLRVVQGVCDRVAMGGHIVETSCSTPRRSAECVLQSCHLGGCQHPGTLRRSGCSVLAGQFPARRRCSRSVWVRSDCSVCALVSPNNLAGQLAWKRRPEHNAQSSCVCPCGAGPRVRGLSFVLEGTGNCKGSPLFKSGS